MDAQPKTDTTLAKIVTATIDGDDRVFQITAETQIDALKESISQVGVLNPPRVIGRRNRWRVVSGFRRIAACIELGISAVSAWRLPPDTTEAACALMAIADNGLQRPLNLVEQIRASRLLLTHYPEASDLNALAAGVGLPPNRKLLVELASLSDAPADLFQAMAAGRISLPMALDLMNRPAQDRASLARVFKELRPSLNRQREMLGLLDDIALRDDLSVAQVLAETMDGAFALTEAPGNGSEPSLQFGRLRAALRARRYPHLSAAEAERELVIKKLQLGPAMQLMPPANFEGRRFELKFSFNTLAEFRERCATCAQLPSNPSMAKLLS